MRQLLKKAALRLLSMPGVTAPLYPLMRGQAAVFMLHRFHEPDRGIEGDSPVELGKALEVLRRRRYELVSLDDVFARLRGEGPPLSRAVAFTIDDGYAEQADVGAPVFAAYDCPVTTFVTSGFLDGELWFWWDRIAYVFASTKRSRLRVKISTDTLELQWANARGRDAAQADFITQCKRVTDTEKHLAIAALAAAAEVDVPARPPASAAPMTWETLRRCEAHGMTFGPHTVTHPVLARTSDDVSRFELEESWRRLEAEAKKPVKIFCYPNGGDADFGLREVTKLKEMRFTGAVVGAWGLANAAGLQQDGGNGAFRMRRFPFPNHVPGVVQCASGLERLKLMLRGAGR
ncbi:MAG TPA: polysaccharide deacetylase family protein [Gemmatimonadaceae bacterium]|nr:polysaccharide deacetylase family protein [Gemmatimonadaceae bacterium]HRQ77458.1 polysaccharide deacetylase family protein [Gemmatimonadaceae bacterium]